MEVITKYRSNDGYEFESEELCLAHEKATETAMEAMKIIQSNCQSLFKEDGLCIGCPFAYMSYNEPRCILLNHEYPKDWKMSDSLEIESEAEELDSFGVDCDNCSNTICGHNFCNIYSVPTSFKKGPGYCKYFTKISK